jgi:hypothetical protein
MILPSVETLLVVVADVNSVVKSDLASWLKSGTGTKKQQ